MFSTKDSTSGDVSSSTSSPAVDETQGQRKNLMSVIASLTPGMLSVLPGSGLLPSPPDNNEDLSTTSTEKTTPNIDSSQNSLDHAPVSGLTSGTSTSNQSNPTKAESSTDDTVDVMSNILHLLYQVASGKPLADDILPSENDEAILSTQHPPDGNQAAFKQLMMSYANGTDRVREILGDEVNIIYECKRCRGMFRCLPNLIRHKTDYCNNTGLMSKILNRTVNSSKEDDAVFQRLLDILHPPEPEAEVVSFDRPMQPEFDYSINRPAPENNKQPQSTSGNKLNEKKYPVMLSKSVASSVPLSDSTSNTAPIATASTFGKFFIGRPTKSATSTLIKPYSCPICKKQMVERKSVRRHLVSIHSLSVVEAYKAMSNTDSIMAKPTVPVPISTSSQFFASNGGRSRKSAPSDTLLRQCVEQISLGPSRTIHVLPQEFVLSSVECPVCNRGLCRRTNVRRHLLEAHNLIIKGEKKYFQLKDIARNTTSNSPTLRRLRHLFTVTNRSPALSESRAKSLASPVNMEHQSKKSDNQFEASILKQDGMIESSDISAASTSISEVSDHLLELDKIKFVESESDNVTKATVSSHPDISAISDRSMSEVFSRNPVTIKAEHETAEDLTMSGRNISREMRISNDEPRESAMHDDDTPEDEPPPKKLRQLAPMVTRAVGQVSLNGQLIGTATQVNSVSNMTLKQGQQNKNNTARSENGVKNLVVRNISSDGLNVPSTVASNGRTLIKVEFRNSTRSSETKQPEKPTSSKSNAKFDIAKLACFTCDKKFKSPPDIRRHLITIHAFTTEEALATCYDCSSVDVAAQSAGLKNGFDITNAKCLICRRFYFSRENLHKHLSRTHHMEPGILQDLKSACSINPDEQDEIEENDSNQNHEEQPPMPSVKEENEEVEEQQLAVENASFHATMTDVCTKEEAAEALKYFPKENINAATLRCLKCKQRLGKVWDFKVHLLKHLRLGFYRCKLCPASARMASCRSLDMVKHFQEIHGFRVRSRDPALQECKVNYQTLWEAYDLPLGKTP